MSAARPAAATGGIYCGTPNDEVHNAVGQFQIGFDLLRDAQ